MISEILYIWMMRNNGSCIFNDWFILFDGFYLYFILFGDFWGVQIVGWKFEDGGLCER